MLFTAVAAIAVIVVSCQKENGPKEPTDIYEKIGKLHNERLDYILREIKTQPVTKGGGRKISTAFIVNATADFMASRGYSSDAITKVGNDLPNSATYNNVVSQLTEKQQSYLDELFKIFDSKQNAKEAITRIKALEKRIKVNCSAEEQPVLLCGTAVARYTIDYWDKHTEEWLAEIGGIEALQMHNVATKAENPESDDFNWKQLGREDAKGAVAGAGTVYVGAATVAAGSGGTLALPSAGVVVVASGGTAVVMSAADAVGQLIDKYF